MSGVSSLGEGANSGHFINRRRVVVKLHGQAI
jgi:hypothetical protein